MRKHYSRVISLCLMAALGLLAFTASAQAEQNSNWMVNGNNIGAMLLPQVQVTEVEQIAGQRHLVLLATLAGGVKFELLCTGMTLEETALKTEGSSLGKGRFTGCVVILSGKKAAACEPHTGKGEEAEAGVLLTRLLKGLIVLHQVSPGVFLTEDRIEPEEGNIIVSFYLGEEECSLGQEISITGKLFVEDGNAEFKIEKEKHLFKQGPLTALSILGVAANIDGAVWTALTGAPHLGLKWSGLPA